MLNKATRKSLLVAALAAMLATPVYAEDYPAEATIKLGRGLANASLGWVELFKNIYNEPDQKGLEYLPIGFVKGVYYTVGRTFLGAADAATFMFPGGSFVHPDYVWENMDKETYYH